VGTLRTSARRLKGKRQRSNLGQSQIKVSCPFMRCMSLVSSVVSLQVEYAYSLTGVQIGASCRVCMLGALG